MSKMKDYLDSKLNEFKREHNVHAKLNRYDGDEKRRWKRDYERTRDLWKEINSVADVKEYIERYVVMVEREEQLRTNDLYTYDIDLALYRAVYAIQKMVHSFDMEGFDWNNLEKEAIDALFSELYNSVEKMKNTITRRASWD